MILLLFLIGKLNSSVKCEIFSKPIKAQGEIRATLKICSIEFLSGTKAGSKVYEVLPIPIIAATKQIVMPPVKIKDIIVSIDMMVFLEFMQI